MYFEFVNTCEIRSRYVSFLKESKIKTNFSSLSFERHLHTGAKIHVSSVIDGGIDTARGRKLFRVPMT